LAWRVLRNAVDLPRAGHLNHKGGEKFRGGKRGKSIQRLKEPRHCRLGIKKKKRKSDMCSATSGHGGVWEGEKGSIDYRDSGNIIGQE